MTTLLSVSTGSFFSIGDKLNFKNIDDTPAEVEVITNIKVISLRY